MKSFKNLFLIATVVISSFTFAADGGGGGSKEDPTAPATGSSLQDRQDRRNTLAVLHSWLRGSQFSRLKQILVESVLGKQPEAAEAVEKEIANNKVKVSVEFVGSGVIALPHFEVKERTLSDLIRALDLEIQKSIPERRNVLLSQPPRIRTLLEAKGIKEVPLVIFKLFLGHNGPEVKDISDIKDGAVLVLSSKVKFFGKLYRADFTGADFTGADLTSANTNYVK